MEEILSRVKTIHLIGIGGIGMTALALLLKEKGYVITGCDSQENYNTALLKAEGIGVSIGHASEHITKAIDLVGYSSAVKDDNCELQQARTQRIPLLQRGALLGLIANNENTVAVAGSHGKTTTSSMIGFLLTSLGRHPTVCVGGVPLNYDRNAWWGKGMFVVETDESDGSFLHLRPNTSLITNIDREHLDHYHSMEKLENSFMQFAEQTKECVIGCSEDAYVAKILKRVKGISYGFDQTNQVRAEHVHFDGAYTCFDLIANEKHYGKVKLALLGTHNVLNTLGALAFFSYLKEDIPAVIDLIKDFKGTKRRFQIKKQCAGVTFVDDYAHHPTEIAAVLNAARSLKPRRVFVIFQPHRFSRVKDLYQEFSKCFDRADSVVITDIYAASEKKIEGIDSTFMLSEVKKNFKGNAAYIPKEQLIKDITPLLIEGDLVLGLGAGDINCMMEHIIDEFEKVRSKT